MDKVRLPKKYRVYIPLVGVFLLFTTIFPRSPKFNYDFKQGSPWMYETLVAKFPFPLIKTEEEMHAERMAPKDTVCPYFTKDELVAANSFDQLEKMTIGMYPELKTALKKCLDTLYNGTGRGVINDLGDIDESAHWGKIAYVSYGDMHKEIPVSNLYTLPEARNLVYNVFVRVTEDYAKNRKNFVFGGQQAAVPDAGLPKIVPLSSEAARQKLEEAVKRDLSNLVAPNLVYEKDKTLQAYQDAYKYSSPTSGVVNAGEIVVEKGEVVTPKIYQRLYSYRAEFESNLSYKGNVAYQWLGNGILAFILVSILFMSIYYTNPMIFGQYNKYLYLLLIYALAGVVSVVMVKESPKFIYMMPYTLIALYLLAFFKKRVVWIVYVNALLPLLLLSHNGPQLFVMYLIAGAVTMYTFAYFNRGWLQFVTAIIGFVALVITWMMFLLVNGIDQYVDWMIILYLFLGSLFSVAGYPLIYLFEKMFRLVSNTKLVELTDTNQPLLRELAEKAPGTFQHCLQVMNLCDAVAREIDANVPLIRAGALYHDIGKMMNPQCFIENETVGVRYHENLTPAESAKLIINHVSDGMAIAEKYHLPDEVKEFIVTHHGTTCAGYFYNRYLQEGGSEEYKDMFTYKGHKPETKEQVILMMCDTLEAASRSLKDYSPESINSLVENLFKSKISDGQLENSDITLHELNMMKAKIKDYLHQIYHARVAYPKKPNRTKE